jgi:hypothetical protein
MTWASKVDDNNMTIGRHEPCLAWTLGQSANDQHRLAVVPVTMKGEAAQRGQGGPGQAWGLSGC